MSISQDAAVGPAGKGGGPAPGSRAPGSQTGGSPGGGPQVGSGAAGRVAARLARQVEVGLARVELSVPQYRLLMFLGEGSVQASALADHLAVSRPSVTAVVDGLVARGLVERRHDESDRRRVGHTITAAGRRLLEEADAAVSARLGEILEHAPDPVSARTALEGLDAWRSALDGLRAARQQEKRAKAERLDRSR